MDQGPRIWPLTIIFVMALLFEYECGLSPCTPSDWIFKTCFWDLHHWDSYNLMGIKIHISDAKERSRLRCNWRRMSILEFDKLAHYNALIIKATRNMTRYHGSFGSHFYNYIRLYCTDFSEQFSPYSTTSTEGPAKLRSKWLTISHDTTLLTSPSKIIHLAN